MPKITKGGGPSHAGVIHATSVPLGVAPPSPEATEPEQEPAAGVEAPARSASRADWARYAEALGHDPKGLTKAKLVKLVG